MEITVWNVFFMLLAVIPVSKMLSTIFMKLIVRIGTVNEDKWAMIGLGAIGATVGALASKGGMLNNLYTGNRNNVSPGGGVTSAALHNIGGGSPGGGGPSASPGGGLSGTVINNQGAIDSAPYRFNNQHNMSGNSAQGGGEDSMGSGFYGANPIAGNAPSGLGGQRYNSSQYDFIPEKGNRSLGDIMKLSGQAGDKAARGMGFLGTAASFPVPPAAPLTAASFAAVGKTTVGTVSTLSNLRQEFKERRSQGQSTSQILSDLTGSNNRIAATTQIASAALLSPLGHKVAAKGSSFTGNLANWGVNKFNN